MPQAIYKNCQGYTLVELLIALTLLALVATPLLALFTNSTLITKNASLSTVAVNLAREQTEIVKALSPENITDLQSKAPVTEENLAGFPGFKRTTTLTAFDFTGHPEYPENSETSHNGSSLLALTVQVSYLERGQERSETVWTLVSLP